MIRKHILLTYSNDSEPILLHTVKWFQVLLRITNNSIKYQSLIYSRLNNQTVIFQRIQFSICQESQMVSSIAMYRNSRRDLSFVHTELNDDTVLFQPIHFSISNVFALNLNVKLLLEP